MTQSCASEGVAWHMGLGRVGGMWTEHQNLQKFLKNRKEGTIAYIPFCLQARWIVSKDKLDFMKWQNNIISFC